MVGLDKKNFKEHRCSINKRKQSADLSEHCLVNDYDFIENDTKVVHFEEQDKKTYLESFEFKKGKGKTITNDRPRNMQLSLAIKFYNCRNLP